MHFSMRPALLLAALAAASWSQSASPAVRRDRDQLDEPALASLARHAAAAAATANTAAAYLQAAQLYSYATDAAQGRQHKAAIKADAQAGLNAAQAAIKLDPNSSNAHALAGYLMGQLIPYVPMGGMRYGERSSAELNKALQLDPHNAQALTAKGISLLFTPAIFGGSTTGAVSELKRAVAAAPRDPTPYIWLAQAYEKAKQWKWARQEIAASLRLDPANKFAQYVSQRIAREAR